MYLPKKPCGQIPQKTDPAAPRETTIKKGQKNDQKIATAKLFLVSKGLKNPSKMAPMKIKREMIRTQKTNLLFLKISAKKLNLNKSFCERFAKFTII